MIRRVDLLNADNDVSISEVLTLDEMIGIYAVNEGVTIEEARNVFYENEKGASPYGRIFSVNIHVTDNYIPRIDFYCETSEGGHFFNIESIYAIQLYRNYLGTVKIFNGYVNGLL